MAEEGRARAPPSLTVTGSLGTPVSQGDEGMELQSQAAGRLRGEGAGLKSRNAGIDRAAAEPGPGQVAPRFPILQPCLERREAGSIIPHWVDKKSRARRECGPLARVSQGSADSPDTPVLYLNFRKLIFA